MHEMLHPTDFFAESRRSGSFSCPEVENGVGCQYIHTQLLPDMWTELERVGDVPKRTHKVLDLGKWWMRRCLSDPLLEAEYHVKTHAKMVLIGTIGAGMFNHT